MVLQKLDGKIIIRDLKEVDCEGDWKTLAWNRVTWRAFVLEAINLQVP